MADINDLALPPSRIYAEIERCLMAQLVPIVRSSPAIGKSDLAHQLAEAYNLKLMDFRLGQADITDLNGLPEFYTDEQGNRRSRFVPFEDFPIEGQALPVKTDADGKPILGPDGQPERYAGWMLFFDELTSAQRQLQAAAYKIILERKVGQRNLHRKVVMMAAGNLESDNAVAHSMSTALQSRLIHLFMRVDHGEWMTWAVKNGIDNRILAYLEFRKSELYNFKPDHSDHTFAAPRTWAFASKLIKGRPVTSTDLPLLAGTISKGTALAFIEYVQIFDTLPKLRDIVRDPMAIILPTDPSVKFALSTMLADQVDDTNVGPVTQFIGRLPVECRVLYARMVSVRKPKLIRDKSIKDLLVDLKDMLK